MLTLVLKSLKNRRLNAGLTIAVIAISVSLFLGVDIVRNQAKSSFADSISGTDLVVGARSGQLNLLLYSVFHIGNATNNIDWRSYQYMKRHPSVAWTVPISLGDSHRGYRVVGTEQHFFEHYQYGSKQSLRLAQGTPFNGLFQVVLGSEVARKLNYTLGHEIVLAHGAGRATLQQHDNMPFSVVGILAPTGTPIDRSLYVSLGSIEAIHMGWQTGRQVSKVDKQAALDAQLTPKTITAFMVGLNSKLGIFAFQRTVNEFRREPLLAIMPAVALQELWSLLSGVETALLLLSGFVVAVGLTGMLTTLLAGLNERRREMAILRSVGAAPRHIFGLLMLEAGALTLIGCVVGYLLCSISVQLMQPFILSQYGIKLFMPTLAYRQWIMLGGILGCGILSGLLPAWRAYRQTLSDGLSLRS